MLVVVIERTLWSVALLLLLFFPAGFSLIRTLLDFCRWECSVTQPVQRTVLWPASWLPAVDKSRGLSRLKFSGFRKFTMSVFNMSRHDALHLDESLNADDVF